MWNEDQINAGQRVEMAGCFLKQKKKKEEIE